MVSLTFRSSILVAQCQITDQDEENEDSDWDPFDLSSKALKGSSEQIQRTQKNSNELSGTPRNISKLCVC